MLLQPPGILEPSYGQRSWNYVLSFVWQAGVVILVAEVYWFWAPSLCLSAHTTLTPQSSVFNFIFASYCWLIRLVEHYSKVQVQLHTPAALIILDPTPCLFTSTGAIPFVCTITPIYILFSFLPSCCAHFSRVASYHPVRDQASNSYPCEGAWASYSI